MSASASQIIYVRGHKTDDDHFHQFYFYINVSQKTCDYIFADKLN